MNVCVCVFARKVPKLCLLISSLLVVVKDKELWSMSFFLFFLSFGSKREKRKWVHPILVSVIVILQPYYIDAYWFQNFLRFPPRLNFFFRTTWSLFLEWKIFSIFFYSSNKNEWHETCDVNKKNQTSFSKSKIVYHSLWEQNFFVFRFFLMKKNLERSPIVMMDGLDSKHFKEKKWPHSTTIIIIIIIIIHNQQCQYLMMNKQTDEWTWFSKQLHIAHTPNELNWTNKQIK